MRKRIIYIISIILLIVYIYAIVFKVFPISTKILLEVVGIIFLFFQLLVGNNTLKPKYIWIIRYAIIIMIWDVITSFINGSNEYHLVIAMMTPILSIFAAHFIYNISRRFLNSETDVLKIIATTVMIESVICICMKLIPSIGAFVNSIQVVQVKEGQMITDFVDYYRFIGLGYAAFYGVLPSTTLGLISSIYLAAHLDGYKDQIRYMLYFTVIAIVSFLTARTTIFIIFIALLLYFKFNISYSKKVSQAVLFSIPVLLAIGFILNRVGADMLEYAFGFIRERDIESGSAGTVIDWWLNTHFDIKTLIIGDARYTNPNGEGYYGGVDIGFYREIFYGGLIFLLMHLYFDFKILYYSYKCYPTKDIKYMMIAFFFCHLVILAKGDASMYSYFILLLVLMDKGIIRKKLKKKIINVL